MCYNYLEIFQCSSGRILRDLDQQSPVFWAPGTSFMEDNFSMDGGGGDGSGGNARDGERWGTAG